MLNTSDVSNGTKKRRFSEPHLLKNDKSEVKMSVFAVRPITILLSVPFSVEQSFLYENVSDFELFWSLFDFMHLGVFARR